MRKGEVTKRRIIEKSSFIFNQRGYRTTSMNDIIQETGIQKGGIYRHFKDKEQLMLEAFEFSVQAMQQHYKNRMKQCNGTMEKLQAFVEAFFDLSKNIPIAGGCPIFNAAIEMDDLNYNPLIHPITEAMDVLTNWISAIVRDGINNGELKTSVDPREISIFVISTLEGALVLYKLKQDEQLIVLTKKQLNQFFTTLIK